MNNQQIGAIGLEVMKLQKQREYLENQIAEIQEKITIINRELNDLCEGIDEEIVKLHKNEKI